MWVLVAYDVATERTEIFRKLLTRYLIHEQNSVFAGAIAEVRHRKLVAEIAKLAHPSDRILQFRAANRHNVEVSHLVKAEGNGTLETRPVLNHVLESVVL